MKLPKRESSRSISSILPIRVFDTFQKLPSLKPGRCLGQRDLIENINISVDVLKRNIQITHIESIK